MTQVNTNDPAAAALAAAAAAPGTPAPPAMAPATPEERAAHDVKVLLANPGQVPAKFINADGSVNADAMLQSYLHLERQNSGVPTDAAAAPAANTAPNTADPAANAAPKPESLAEALNGATPPAGADLWKQVETELAAGEVTEASLKGLKEAGVPDSLIALAAHGASTKKKTDMDAALGITGGQEGFDATMQFVRDNFDATQQEGITQAFSGPNSLLVLQGLHAQMVAAGAASGQVNTATSGNPAIAPDADASLRPFASPQDQVNAMRDKRYKTDDNYRREVEMRVLIGRGATRETLREMGY